MDEAEIKARKKLLEKKASKSLKSLVEKKVNSDAQGQKTSSSIQTEKKQGSEEIAIPNASTGSSVPESGDTKQPLEGRRQDRSRERQPNKTMTNRDEAGPPGVPRDRERSAPPPRGDGGRYFKHPPPHYRDEFGRRPPTKHWDEYDRLPPPGGPRGPPPMRHRGRFPPPPHHREGGMPSGRWERDRGNLLPPHPRMSRRSPPARDRRHRNNHPARDDRLHRNRHDRYRSRRGRSHGSDRSRSYSSRSRSRSRSFSSRSSSSSFSSDENHSRRSSNYHSDASRSRSSSRSRSRSYSRSRSPSPRSSIGKETPNETGQDKLTTDQQKLKTDDGNKDKDNLVKTKHDGEKTEECEKHSPSSKVSNSPRKSNDSMRNRSPSRSMSEDSRDRSGRRGRERKRSKNNRSSRSLSRSHSRTSSVSRSRSPISSSYSTSSSHYSRERRRSRRSKRRRKRHDRGSTRGDKKPEDEFSKDQRTIFVSQLVMRTTERDLKRYFKKIVGCKVNDVILLRDRRNARNHKGCAYVEVGRIEDVATAVAVSGKPPTFQRFPILVKASEAEKNYVNPTAAVSNNLNGHGNNSGRGDQSTIAKDKNSFLPPLRDENGRLIESQKVYVGGLDPSVREEHLHAIFSQFGTLLKVQLQCHPNTQISRGYAFLAFRDPKVSHLAIQTMAGKIVAGRALKTGWASQNQQSAASIASGCIVVTSDKFPENASELAQKALLVLLQMTEGTTTAAAHGLPDSVIGTSDVAAISAIAEQELNKVVGVDTSTSRPTSAHAIPTVAEARASMAAGATVAEARASLKADVVARQLAAATSAAVAENRVATPSKSSFIGNADHGPTRHLLVHNMFDKDEETEDGWESDIKEEFLDECSKFGKIEHANVIHTEPGGKIYATFANVEGAKTCAENLAGRWFDKRQLRVDYMQEANPP